MEILRTKRIENEKLKNYCKRKKKFEEKFHERKT